MICRWAKSPPPSEVRKKKSLRAAEEPATLSPFMVMGSDPALWPQSQWARTSAFKPWSPIVPGSKERALGKEHHPHLPLLPAGAPAPLYPKNSLPYSMVAYFPPGAEMAGLHKLDPGIVKLDPDRPELCLLPPTAVAAAAAAAAQQRHLLKKQMQAEGEVVAKKEAPRSRTGSVDSGQGGPPAKAVNGRVSADTDETMSNSSLSTLSGVEEVGLPAEDCLRGDACPGVPPELEGLWGAFERHSVGDRARQDIVREVQLLLAAACQQRHLLGMGLAGYRLLLHQQQASRQESERLPCKLGPGLGGEVLPPGPSPHPAKSISPPSPSPLQPPSSSCDAEAPSPVAGEDRGEPMVLSREMPRPLVEKTLPLLAT
ncbi:hypothetical protein IscW_ISCW005432 [Ixodes scapularis]|uniref:Uncharacterized protein n=1 Tax=Ixodes scapularis TaxID=6945 RepID=B7PLC0_IXOSC|nr:hypothetical protein IscW_ISCW005432 [Ixodes scapularis]|eukprot:XP_002434568.1 hypothetical protein IscW_ISCW005432 [Ixodes scapularis]